MCTRNLIAVILLAATTGWTAGPASGSPKPVVKNEASKSAPARAKPDAEIERDIRAKFARSKINQDKFTVHVQGGLATIEGKTDVIQHKGVATRMAKTGGAAAVANHIEISEAARDRAAANLESGRRRAQIKRSDPRSQATTAR